MEPNANTNKDDITPPETKPNQPETPARLLIAILVVAADDVHTDIEPLAVAKILAKIVEEVEEGDHNRKAA